jgi:hypothetical protein
VPNLSRNTWVPRLYACIFMTGIIIIIINIIIIKFCWSRHKQFSFRTFVSSKQNFLFVSSLLLWDNLLPYLKILKIEKLHYTGNIASLICLGTI